MNLIHILSCSVNIQRREPYLYNFIKNVFNIGLYADIYGLISFRLAMMIGTTKFYTLICLGDLDLIQGHSCIGNQNFCVHFLRNFAANIDEIQWVANICWFVEAHAKFIVHNFYSSQATADMI